MAAAWVVVAAVAINLTKKSMKKFCKKIISTTRRTLSRASSLLLLFQKTPLMQFLLPEASVLGNAHVINAAALTIATVAGLGAYDSVSGATAVAQTSPSAGSSTVAATSGTNLNFVVQITGAGGHTPASWTVTGALPPGMTHANAKNSKTDSISGIPTQAGSYPLTIKAWENSGGSGRSATGSFTINVAAPPGLSFTTQPLSKLISRGSSTTLQCTVSGGTGITYQWYQGNSGVTSTPVGTNSSNFTTPNLNNSTSYWVKASSAAFPAGKNSNTAVVTVMDPPNITAQPTSQTIAAGVSATLSVTATGGIPLTYQWYQGVSGNTATPVGTNSSSFTTPSLSTNTSYWVKVSNPVNTGGVASDAALISVMQPAAIVTHPLGQTIDPGQSATLSVVAAGTGPISYQWFEGAQGDVSNPVGANESTYTSPSLNSSKSYWVRVSNALLPTGVNSSAALVRVIQPLAIETQPLSQDVAVGKPVTLQVIASGQGPYTYQWYQGAVGVTTTPVGKGLSSFVSPALKVGTSYWVRIKNPFNTVGLDSQAAVIQVLTPVTIATQPAPTIVISGGFATMNVVAAGTAPFSYQWYQGKVGDITMPVGTDSATLETPILNANSMFWVKVKNSVTPAGVSSKAAAVTVQIPASISKQPINAFVKTGAAAKLSVVAAGTPKFAYQWYQGESGDTSRPVGKVASAFTTPKLTATTSYWVKVTNGVNPTGSFSDTVTVTVGNPPAIVAQPASIAITSGDTTTLSITATGIEPMTYQWYEGKAGVITKPVGTNSATFSTPALTATTSYWVMVKNPLLPKGLKSAAAIVTVNPAAASAARSLQGIQPVTLQSYAIWAASQWDEQQMSVGLDTATDADPDGDGLANAMERLLGTNPQKADASLLAIQTSAGEMQLRFTATSTQASVDQNMVRHFAIETCTDLRNDSWTLLEKHADITAQDQEVQVNVPISHNKAFYRLKAWLSAE